MERQEQTELRGRPLRVTEALRVAQQIEWLRRQIDQWDKQALKKAVASPCDADVALEAALAQERLLPETRAFLNGLRAGVLARVGVNSVRVDVPGIGNVTFLPEKAQTINGFKKTETELK